MEAFAPDACDDACSICLEPFSAEDPAMVTNCKHEYHLQCILEWAQRSRECPICSQALVLSDPASQELLAAMEVKSRGIKTRRSGIPAFNRISTEDLDSHNVSSFTEDMDFDEHFVQQLAAAAMSRGHPSHRRERHHRSAAIDHSQLLIFSGTPNDYDSQQRDTAIPNETQGFRSFASLSGDSSCTPTTPIIIDELSLESLSPSSGILGLDRTDDRHNPINTRVPSSQTLPGSPQRSRQSEIVSFSESLKSKLAAASSRYKESISKSTRGFKEKLLARNSSVKELSKGVQREVTAGIAGVARLMERLDPSSKRSGIGSIYSGTAGTSELSCSANVEEEGQIMQAPDGSTGTTLSVTSSNLPDTAADTLCLSPCTIATAHAQNNSLGPE